MRDSATLEPSASSTQSCRCLPPATTFFKCCGHTSKINRRRLTNCYMRPLPCSNSDKRAAPERSKVEPRKTFATNYSREFVNSNQRWRTVSMTCMKQLALSSRSSTASVMNGLRGVSQPSHVVVVGLRDELSTPTLLHPSTSTREWRSTRSAQPTIEWRRSRIIVGKVDKPLM